LDTIYVHMATASDDIASGYPEVWHDIASAIVEATQDFKDELAHLDRLHDGAWKGETRDAAMNSVRSSFVEPETASAGAAVMGILVEAFANTISTIKESIVGNKQDYDRDRAEWPEYHDEIKRAYDEHARSVMQDVYSPSIKKIAEYNPAFTAGGTSEVEPLDPAPGGPYSPGDPGLGGGASGPFDGAEIPDLAGPMTSDLPQMTSDLPQTVPTGASTIPTPAGLGGLTDPVRAASDAAQKALGAATDAAKQAVEGAQRPVGPGQGDLPEGVLGLGPKGLGGLPSAGGAGGKTGADMALPHGLAGGRTAGGAVTAPPKLPGLAGTTSGAGLGAMGPPGSGSPAAAQRGGEPGKGHQVLKGLRRTKTGQQVVGEAKATVPVIGAPKRTPKPEADPPAQPDNVRGDVQSVPAATRHSEPATQVASP
jgi:hypothetical protein